MLRTSLLTARCNFANVRLARRFSNTSANPLYIVGFGEGLNEPENGYFMPDFSPFSTKVATYLKMAGVPFQMVSDQNLSPAVGFENAPKNKIPYLIHGDNAIGDSHFMVNYINSRFKVDLDGNLTDEEKSLSTAFSCLIEEHLYWGLAASRYIKSEWDDVTVKYYFSPNYYSEVSDEDMDAHELWRKYIFELGLGQGMFRHTEEEITEIVTNACSSLSNLLGHKPYFFGNSPSRLDAAAYGQLSGLIPCPWKHQINQNARSFNNLNDFCSRIQETYYKTTLEFVPLEDVTGKDATIDQ